MTSDAKAAEEFYARVIGGRMVDAGQPGMAYTLACIGEHQGSGGRGSAGVLRPADDIPSVGRFAVIADPQGEVLVLFNANIAP